MIFWRSASGEEPNQNYYRFAVITGEEEAAEETPQEQA